MKLTKQLLRKELNLISENFFKKEEAALDEVIECVKDLMVNLRHALEERHKLDFFKNRLAKALVELKDLSENPKKILSKVSELESEFEESVLKKLGIIQLLIKISKNKKPSKLIDDYITDIDSLVESVYETYKENTKKDKQYEAIKSVINDSKKLSYKKFLKKKYLLQIELLKLQEWAVENNKRIIILFEGRDAAGKGSNIETFKEFLNPKHTRVETFGIPTEDEKNNWFKRYKKVLPKEGEIVLFDRSWYNRSVIEPAMGYCTKKQYEEFMDEVGDFEKKLIEKEGVILIKLWFDITKDNQKLRFELRKRDPLRYWKFSKNDESMVANWDKLTPYIEKTLEHTNFLFSPWVMINSDDKYKGILSAMENVLERIHYAEKSEVIAKADYTPTKVVFLDIHGVIITKTHELENGEKDCNKGWDKTAIKNLNKLTDETNAKIVMISSCKNNMVFDDLKANLKSAGVTGEVIGKTVPISKYLRGEQIQSWLDHHNVTDFVVLDDVAYDTEEEFPGRLILVNPNDGLTQSDYEKALKEIK